jgi:hypothetical protein
VAVRGGSRFDAPVANNGYRMAFLIGAIYDGLLGVLFLVASGPILQALRVDVPDNPVYLQLAAGLIALMGLLQYYVWRDMERNLDIIRVLIAFKAYYVLLALVTTLRGDLPHPVFGVLAVIDLLFLIAFLGYLRAYGRPARIG